MSNEDNANYAGFMVVGFQRGRLIVYGINRNLGEMGQEKYSGLLSVRLNQDQLDKI